MSNWQFTKYFIAALGLLLLIFWFIPLMITDPSDGGVLIAIISILGLVYVGGLTLKNLLDRNNRKDKK